MPNAEDGGAAPRAGASMREGEKMKTLDKIRFLDGTALKLIAMVSMVFDHVGDIFL